MFACVAAIQSQPRVMKNGRKIQVIVKNRHTTIIITTTAIITITTTTRPSSSLHNQLHGLRAPIQLIHHSSNLRSQLYRRKARPPATPPTSSPKIKLPSRRDHRARILYITLTNIPHLHRRNLKAPVLDIHLTSPLVTRLRPNIQIILSSLRRQRRSRHSHTSQIIALGFPTLFRCIRDNFPTHRMEDTSSHKRPNPARSKQLSARANQPRLSRTRARSANLNLYNRVSNRMCNRFRKVSSPKVKLPSQTPRMDSAWPHSPKSTPHSLMDSAPRLWHPQRRRESLNTPTRSSHQPAADRVPASGPMAKFSTRSTSPNRCIVGCGLIARGRTSLRSRPRTDQWRTNMMLRV